MNRPFSYASVLPDGWVQDLLHKADLEESLADLATCRHFHATTMRGRMLSLLLRRSEARRHFKEALCQSRDAPEDVPTRVRLFLLEVYRFENELLGESALSRNWSPEVSIPELPEPLARAYPAINYAWHVRVHTEGVYQLSVTGDVAHARELFRTGVESDAAGPDGAAFSCLYLACCEHALGDHEEASRLLESAGIAIHASDYLVNQVHAAALLRAAHAMMAQHEEAKSWEQYLETRACSGQTKRAFLARSERVIELSTANRRFMLV